MKPLAILCFSFLYFCLNLRYFFSLNLVFHIMISEKIYTTNSTDILIMMIVYSRVCIKNGIKIKLIIAQVFNAIIWLVISLALPKLRCIFGCP